MADFDLSNMVIKNVISVTTMYSPDGAGSKRSNRQRWAVMLKYEGETVYFCNGKSYLSNMEHAVLLPRGCSYEWQCKREGHFMALELECDGEYCEPIVFTLQNSEKLLKILKTMESHRNRAAKSTRLESIRDAYSVLLLLHESSADRYYPNEKRDRLAPAMDFISHHFTDPIKNDTLAEMCGVSNVYFRKLFTVVYGTSPIAYARDLRIRKAKEMLRGDYSSLSDIAFSLGYPSLYDFSRDFKKHTGVPPSKYLGATPENIIKQR